MRLRALGQRLLRVCATWVRDQTTRVLIRVDAGDPAEDDERSREGMDAAPDGRERDASARGAAAADAPPEHWRTLVDNAPPRHWLDRVEAARRRFASIRFDARAKDDHTRPAPDELLEHSRAESEPPVRTPVFDPRDREERAGAEPTARGDRAVHEAPPSAPLPRVVPQTDLPPAQDDARPDRPLHFENPIGRTAASPSPDFRNAEQPTASSDRPAPRADLDRRSDAPAPRLPAPQAEAFAWQTVRKSEDVEPADRPILRPEGAAPIVPVAGPNPNSASHASGPDSARRASNPPPLCVDRATTSRGAESVAWPELPLPDRTTARDVDVEGEPASPVRQGSRGVPAHAPPPSARPWPPLPDPEPLRPRVAPAFAVDAARAASLDSRADEPPFYTDEPGPRWPELPDPPAPAGREDWMAMKRRLDRMDRLEREQRGW